MISFKEPFKELCVKTEPLIKNTKRLSSQYKYTLSQFFSPTRLILSRIYASLISGVAKTCEFLTFIILMAATSIHFLAYKVDLLLKYLRRKIHVWKILSARHQWYLNKKGNFYNPKLKATIYPSWECTWNIAQSSDHYQGYESKKQAQEVAFKMWMKMRRLRNRLDRHYDAELKIPLNLGQKILSNKIHLRKPGPQDIAQLLALMEQQLGYCQVGESMKTRIHNYAGRSNQRILVAERGKKIIGFIAFVIYDLFMSEGKRCRIEGLVVDPKERDLRVKRKLIQAIEVFARDNNSIIIDLTTDSLHAKEGIHDFYKFLGYSSEGSLAKAYLRKEL